MPIDAADGQPAALWGFGGREGGRPVPSAEALAALTQDAAAYSP